MPDIPFVHPRRIVAEDEDEHGLRPPDQLDHPWRDEENPRRIEVEEIDATAPPLG